MLARGKTYDDIAALLPISIKTIHNIKMKDFKKLAIENHDQPKGLMYPTTEVGYECSD